MGGVNQEKGLVLLCKNNLRSRRFFIEFSNCNYSVPPAHKNLYRLHSKSFISIFPYNATLTCE